MQDEDNPDRFSGFCILTRKRSLFLTIQQEIKIQRILNLFPGIKRGKKSVPICQEKKKNGPSVRSNHPPPTRFGDTLPTELLFIQCI